jgi:hypothetical protein
VKNPPDWLKTAVADSAVQVLSGGRTEAEATATVAAAIMAGHPEFVGELVATLASAQVSAWVKARQTSGDLFQAALFPGIPPVMHVNVRDEMATADMTAADLEKAKNMLLARTRNARESADRQQKDFMAFYRKVRPLLKDGKTVADVLPELAAKAA